MYNAPQTDHTFFEQLNEDISSNASTFVGIFRRNDIEHKDGNFKLVDTCSGFSLSIGSTRDSYLGCHDEFAIFSITEQKAVRHNKGHKHISNLVIAIKCQYKNYEGILSTFSFRVVVNYDVTRQGYFHNLSVNSNGTLLIIHSQTTCVICRVPNKLSDPSVLLDGAKVLPDVLQGIKIVELNEDCNIVKAKFSSKHPNVFCLVTMESLDVADGGNYSFAKLSHTNNLEIFNDVDLHGIIRIFDVEFSIDTPLFSMKLSEQMCRSGKEINSGNHTFEKKRSKTPGALVDLFWNENDTSYLGSLTLFVLSNYGMVFAYCPVIVSTICNFSTKLKLVEGSLDLLDNGFIFYDGKSSIDTKSDVLDLLQSLYHYEKGVENGFELFPTIIKLNIDTKRLTSHSTSSFESFIVMSTYPELTIIASTFDGNISAFKSSSLIPQTSHFFNPNTLRNLHYIDSFVVLERTYFKGSKLSFIPVSSSTCLLYSLYESFIITLSNVLKSTQIVHNTKIGDFLYYFSQPVTVLRPGGKGSTPETEYRNLAFLFPYYCYIKDYEILKYDSIIVRTMNVDFNTGRIDDDFIFRCPSIKLSSHINDSDNSDMSFVNHQSFPKYAISTYKFSGLFSTLKVCINDKIVLKQKIIEFIKTISSMDSNTLENIKVRDNYGEIIDKMQIVNKAIVDTVDTHFDMNFKFYTSLFKDLKIRIDKIRNTNQVIIARHEELIRLISKTRELQMIDNNILTISNTITTAYLKHSSVLFENMIRKLHESRAFDNESVKELIGEWLSSSTMRNISAMIDIFKRVQLLRNRLISIY